MGRLSWAVHGSNIIARRAELAAEGRNDWSIACVIAEELGTGPRAIESGLSLLRKKGEIPENPNKNPHNRSGFDLKAFRDGLMAEGLCDGAIAAAASEKCGRGVASLKTSICAMVKGGKAPANPNNQREAAPGEYRWLIRRFGQLASIGLNARSISNVLAYESERTPEALRRQAWDLGRDGVLPRAGKGGKPGREMEHVILARARMMGEGKNEMEIAGEISGGMGKRVETVRLMMVRAVRAGGCPENTN